MRQEFKVKELFWNNFITDKPPDGLLRKCHVALYLWWRNAFSREHLCGIWSQLRSKHLKTHPFPAGGEIELPADLDCFGEMTCQSGSRGFTIPLFSFTLRKCKRSCVPSTPAPCHHCVMAGGASPQNVSIVIPHMLAPVQEHFRASVQSWVQRSKPYLSTALHGTKWPPRMSLN